LSGSLGAFRRPATQRAGAAAAALLSMTDSDVGRGGSMPLGLSPLQMAGLAIVGLMLACFAWGRWRYDLVAALALLAATLIGVVPQSKAFEGFSNPVIIIIAAVLVVSRAISSSGILDSAMRRV